jgi:hypothetical protein
MVKSMNFDLKVAPQALFFQQLPNQSRLKSHSVRREQSGLPSNGSIESAQSIVPTRTPFSNARFR